jgi:hypothetical protein
MKVRRHSDAAFVQDAEYCPWCTKYVDSIEDRHKLDVGEEMHQEVVVDKPNYYSPEPIRALACDGTWERVRLV